MAYKRYSQPIEITAKFSSSCSCGAQIKKGQRIMYNPGTRKAYCEKCSAEIKAGMRAEQSYEQYGTDCAYDY